MHELSIVMNVIAIAEDEAAKANANTIEEIELDIGRLSTVDLEAFNFAWHTAVKETILEKALTRINDLEGKATCPACNIEFNIDTVYEVCPSCNKSGIRIVQGQELKVKRIVLNSINPN